MARFDVHRPSVIDPADYEFISFNYLPGDGDVLGTAMFLADERRKRLAHMKMTGGRYSGHEHGGACHVCGSVNAVYTACFFHAKSNTYIVTGLDCAEKLECHGVEAFRKKVTTALEAGKGKRKAKAVLERDGLGAAWALYEADAVKRTEYANECAAWRKEHPEPVLVADGPYGAKEVGAPVYKEWGKDEMTVLDMVARLIKWGDISDKATSYMKVLLDRIARAPEIAAARAAETEAAKPVPAKEGRWLVEGEVLSVRKEDGFYGYAEKALIKHADGWKLFGNLPSALHGSVERGDKLKFVASVVRSDKDEKFGFWKRPAKAEVFKKEEEKAA